MSIGKNARPKGPALNAAQHRMNLAMALLRGEAAAISLRDSGGGLPTTTHDKFLQLKQELMTQQIGAIGRWFSYLQLYYATVHVIVRTWQRAKLADPEISALLEDKRIVAMLTDFRNDLMHGGSFLSDEVSAFFDNLPAIDAWAFKLRQACELHVVNYFATPRSSNQV